MRFDWTLELQEKGAIKDIPTKKLICSKHFKPELVIERNGREFLVPNSVPTLFLTEVCVFFQILIGFYQKNIFS